MSTPLSTYRLQIRPSWDLYAAAEICAYLADLGVDAVYLSPLLPSVTGSEHGYDVIGWDGVDPQRGGDAGWRAFLDAARAAGLRVVVDIVPNHCATSPENAAWTSVLEHGVESPYARWFDIEWSHGRMEHYRRFFAVDGLAGLRVEDPEVFDATHATILRWVRDDGVDGLRIDHPDGLADPKGYLERLRAAVGPDCWLIVEKILEEGERLPESWPVAGTTGYDALTPVTQLLLSSADPLNQTEQKWADVAAGGKREVATTILRPEVRRLARLVPNVARADEALTELLVAMPVYRSYLPEGAQYLAEAIGAAQHNRPDLADTIDELAARLGDPADELCSRFQQTSGAVMAKGVEDTAFYRYNRLIALNEVGGNPAPSTPTLHTFHDAQLERQQHWPNSMTTLSTHDTKRSEDVRARLLVLAEIPEDWNALATTLMKLAPLPDRPLAELLWQTFVGAGFIDRGRMHAYVEKAMREAGTSTSWLEPNERFESVVHATIDRAYDDPALREPLDAFIGRITPYGWINSLSQKLVQLTGPGVPDVYQGTERWDDSLVDPDNRRPVDFDHLRARLGALDAPPAIDASGDAKLWITSRALRVRRERAELFSTYTPIDLKTEHAVAFDRGGAITVATRLPVGHEIHGGWGQDSISLSGSYTDVLTERTYEGRTELDRLLRQYPVALLIPAT